MSSSTLAFDFELIISGLCLLTFEGQDIRRPTAANVHLVMTSTPDSDSSEPHRKSDGHHHGNGNGNGNGRGNGNGQGGHEDHLHLSLLSFQARDLTPRSAKIHRLSPGLDGLQLGHVPLEGKGQIVLDALSVQPGVSATWKPEGNTARVPDGPEEEAWLDWVPKLALANPGARISPGSATASLRITQGTVEAAQVARGLSGQYLLWDFKTPGGFFTRTDSQALAGLVVVRLKNLTQPVRFVIEQTGEFIELAGSHPTAVWQGGSVVRACLSNLPQNEIRPSQKLDHFALYFGARPEAISDLRIPEAADRLDTTAGNFCPPGSN